MYLNDIINTMSKKEEKIDYLKYMSYNLIGFIIIPIILSAILFIFKINISIYHFYISILLLLIVNLYYIFKYKKVILKNILLLLGIPSILIVCSFVINSYFHDVSYDGNTYHKVAVGALSDGWNPLYQDIEDINSLYNDGMKTSDFAIWNNHYAKGMYFYSAAVYKATNNIECGTSITLISLFSLFLYGLSVLLKKFNRKISIVYSFLLVSCSCLVSQMFCYYNDSLVYVYLSILFIFLIDFLINKKNIKYSEYFPYISSLIMLINIKFTGFGYAGVYTLLFYIYLVYQVFKTKKIDRKVFNRFTIVSALVVLFSVLIVGSSTYIKNTVDHQNPFYPLLGSNKEDIFATNQPLNFNNKSNISKFIMSNFSRSDNPFSTVGGTTKYKIPFTFDRNEIRNLGSNDLRVGGYGVLFSGILILSFVFFIINDIKLFKTNKNQFIILNIIPFISVLLIFLINGSWWARYFPMLYSSVLINLLIIYLINNKSIIFKALVTLLLINNFITGGAVLVYNYTLSSQLNYNYKELSFDIANKTKLILKTNEYYGLYYNIRDYNNKNLKLKLSIDNANNKFYIYDMKKYILEVNKVEAILE